MISKILSEMTQILRGKNGTVYYAIMLFLVGVLILKILPKIIWLGIMSTIVFLIFKRFEKKHSV